MTLSIFKNGTTPRYLRGVATLALDSTKCNGCGRCREVCPHAVFAVEQQGRVRIADLDACMECGACAKNCQVGAISVRAGVGCANAVINGLLKGTEPNCDCGADSRDGCC